jgi:hypothetical protein
MPLSGFHLTTESFQLNSTTRGLITAILRPSTDEDIAAIKRDWIPKLQDAKNNGASCPELNWDWAEYVCQGNSQNGFLCLTLSCGSSIEGFLFVSDTDKEKSRFIKDARILYVERVAVAPWNQPLPVGTQDIRGIGKNFFRITDEISCALGYQGRYGLHSEKSSESYYRSVLKLREGGPEQIVEDTGPRLYVYFESD